MVMNNGGVSFMNAKDAEKAMNKMGNTPFVVIFEKRTDATIRTMKVKNGVMDATKGGALGFDPSKRNLRLVVDLEAMMTGNGWRMIPLDRVISVRRL